MIYHNEGQIIIRDMNAGDAQILYDTYASYGWHPDIETYNSYYRQQKNGERLVFIPEYEGKVSGQCTLMLHPTDGTWGGKGIPEIVDLTVFFDKHRHGIGNKLLDVAEAEAAKISDMVYLAVGVHSGYGAAQRIYVKRGYIPDGIGVWYHGRVLEQYAPCVNDDDLVLYLTKILR